MEGKIRNILTDLKSNKYATISDCYVVYDTDGELHLCITGKPWRSLHDYINSRIPFFDVFTGEMIQDVLVEEEKTIESLEEKRFFSCLEAAVMPISIEALVVATCFDDSLFDDSIFSEFNIDFLVSVYFSLELIPLEILDILWKKYKDVILKRCSDENDKSKTMDELMEITDEEKARLDEATQRWDKLKLIKVKVD